MHEYIISHLNGFMNCKNYKKCKIPADIMKKDKSIFIELKNKHNTVNSGSKKTIINNLIFIKEKYPDAIVCIGVVIGKNTIKKIPNNKNVEIYEYSGNELSKLVYETDNLFDNLKNEIIKYFNNNKEIIKPIKIKTKKK